MPSLMDVIKPIGYAVSEKSADGPQVGGIDGLKRKGLLLVSCAFVAQTPFEYWIPMSSGLLLPRWAMKLSNVSGPELLAMIAGRPSLELK